MTTPPQNQTDSMSSASSTSAGSAGGPTAGDGGSTRASAERLAEDAKTRTRAELDRARDTAARKAETLAESARAAADALGRDDIGHLSQYVSNMADGMTRFADGLRHKSGDEIARDIGRMARENPALFIAGGVAIGFGLSRFARASQHHSHAMVPADEARTDLGFAEGRSTTADDRTVYSTGSLGSGDTSGDMSGDTLDTGFRDKGGMH